MTAAAAAVGKKHQASRASWNNQLTRQAKTSKGYFDVCLSFQWWIIDCEKKARTTGVRFCFSARSVFIVRAINIYLMLDLDAMG
jgi:hypothetical protein